MNDTKFNLEQFHQAHETVLGKISCLVSLIHWKVILQLNDKNAQAEVNLVMSRWKKKPNDGYMMYNSLQLGQ